MISAKILAVQLRELREEFDMPSWEFAERLGVTPSYLSQLERSDNRFFTMDIFERLPSLVDFILHKSIRLIFHFGDGKKLEVNEAAEWIRTTRKEANQSQTEYSVKMGLAPGAITRLERGQIKSLRSLAQIAEAHGATLEMEIYETD